ncbi:hypothetical protein SUGI_0381740 [Cryptomeria japonica]|nr:hypothetical protein SUGI_0381740 [Cryptomeria japonica]
MTEVLKFGFMEDKGFVEQKRRLKTPSQVEALENIYAEHKYPSEPMKTKLSQELGLSEKQVQRWFRHRRLKDKKGNTNNNKKEDPDSNEELDAGSGSNPLQQQQQQQAVRRDFGHLPNQRLSGTSDYPSAVLGAEMNDHDVLKRRSSQIDVNGEDTLRAGNVSTSQDTSSLQSRSSFEMEALRNRNYVEIRGNNSKKSKGQVMHRGMEHSYTPQLFLMASQEQTAASVLKQCSGNNGFKGLGGSNIMQTKNRNHVKDKEESNRFSSSHDYPSAVLAAELTDRELLKGSHEVTEDPYVSVSQERSSLQSGSSFEIEARRSTFKGTNPFEIEARSRRRDIEGLQTAVDQLYGHRYNEHQAIVAVKAQLGRAYHVDGPVLGIEFDPLPSGAFGLR